MSPIVEIVVPDLGAFQDVPVTEVLVEPGDQVAAEDPLLVVESEKAALEIPAPRAGRIAELKVSVGDTVSKGTLIAMLDVAADETSDAQARAPVPDEQPAAESPAPSGGKAGGDTRDADDHATVLVIGSGPGGYAAAFRAADLGLDVTLVEREPTLGGVCLNVGCIPSKALLHAAKVIGEASAMEAHGIAFGAPKVDVDALRAWKDSVVGKLVSGVTGMAKHRKVRVVQGTAKFTGPNAVSVATARDATTTISFDHAIIAAGSRPVRLPGIPDQDMRVMDSTGALALEEVPRRLLVIGGGIIGLEMAMVYDALGSEVTVVELADQLVPGADPDLVKPLHRRIEGRYAAIHLGTKVETIKAARAGLKATFSGDVPDATFDRVLVAVGRTPNGRELDAEQAGVEVTERGFIEVDAQQRTNVPHIHAIGDIAGQPMLAHKATAEGHVAAEVIAGHDAAYDVRAMPSVAYTEPEIAWAGLTETEAKAAGTPYEKAVVPWSASGRALSIDASAGLTKLLYDPDTGRVLGGGIVGTNAGELIAEVCLAIEMGADIADVGLTVHPHPTLSETVSLAAELADGTATDLPPARGARRSGAMS